MAPEAWLALTFAAALLPLFAGGILAWVVGRRFARAEQITEQRWRTLNNEVRGLEKRVTELESMETRTRSRSPVEIPVVRGKARVDSASEPRLISVPSLESAESDRDITASGLRERHAAIWALADTGAAPEVIARATGQPIGQIELVLGLKRQIDATGTNFSHTPHV